MPNAIRYTKEVNLQKLVSQYCDTPADQLPDLRPPRLRQGLALLGVGVLAVCAWGVGLANTNSDGDVAVLFLVMFLGVCCGAGGIMMLVLLPPSKEDLAAAIAQQRRSEPKPLEPGKPRPGRSPLPAAAPEPVEPRVLQSVRVLNGHAASVNSVSYSPDGKTLASASGSAGDPDNTVRIWDAATGEPIHLLKGHNDEISCLGYSPDSKTLVSVEDCMIAWDVAEGKASWSARDEFGVRYVSVCYAPNGQTMACGFANGVIRMWEAETGHHIRSLEGHFKGVKCVSYSPDSTILASASFDNTIRLWDVATGRQLRTMDGHQDSVRGVAFSPDGKTLASASDDKTVRLWTTATGAQLRLLKGHEAAVTTVRFSPDGAMLASGSQDKTVRLWDVASGMPLYVLKGHDGAVKSVNYSPDGATLASGSADKTIRLWAVSAESLSAPRSTPLDTEMAQVVDRIAREEATAISVFLLSGEANARAQAKAYASWVAKADSGLGVYLLEAASSTEQKRFLLVRTGSRKAQRHLTDSRADFDKLKSVVLSEDESVAITPAACYENFAQPGCSLTPSGTLEQIVEQLKRGEYNIDPIAIPSLPADPAPVEPSVRERSESAPDLSKALAKAENEARQIRSTPVRQLSLREEMGTPVVAWSSPDDGREFNSDKAREILTRQLSPLGYAVTGVMVGPDRQNRECYCHLFLYKRSGDN